MASSLPGPEAKAPPALSDHPQEEILIRIGAPADLVHASVACKTFLRLITDPTFLRRYRSLHPPLLLGYVAPGESEVSFLPAEAPHPNASVARAFTAAADFSVDHHHPERRLPVQPRYDARVLLMYADYSSGGVVSPELLVCDPLTGGYTPLPPIPDDLRASVFVQAQDEYVDFAYAIFDPSVANEEGQFRVLCWASCFSMAVVFVYSSASGCWSHGTSKHFSALGWDLPREDSNPIMFRPSYAFSCLYWDYSCSNMVIKLDINIMEFTSVTLPPDYKNRSLKFVEAGDGRIWMFSLFFYGSKNPESLRYSIWQNESENASERSVENIIPLPCEYHSYHFDGAAQGYIFLTGTLKDTSEQGDISAFFSLDIKTLKIERVCLSNCIHHRVIPYFGFPPFMSPRTM